MTDHKTNGISRRSIAKGAAWAAPVIAVAATAPFAAASHHVPPEPEEIPGTRCKQPGNSGNLSYGYYGQFTIENPTDAPITYTFVSFVAEDGTSLSGIQVMSAVNTSWSGATSTITVPANSTVTYWIRGYGTNSQASTFTVSYVVGGNTFNTTFAYDKMQPCCTSASGNTCPPGETAVVTSTTATTEKQAAPASTSEASTASSTEQAAPTTESAAPASETTVAPATESATATEAPASVSK